VHLDEVVLRKDPVATDFTRQMSHEIRTPLNVIIGLCQYLERDRNTALSPVQRESLVRMERNAHALLESVNHLLECVRTGKYD
jgi:two-component system, sensor histidine kinase and response regulator